MFVRAEQEFEAGFSGFSGFPTCALYKSEEYKFFTRGGRETRNPRKPSSGIANPVSSEAFSFVLPAR